MNLHHKSILYVVLTIVALAVMISRAATSSEGFDPTKGFANRERSQEQRQLAEQEQGFPLSINMLLDNSMSALDQTKSFDREIETFMRRWELKGASFALMRGDSLLYAKGYGIAKDSTRCEVYNVLRIASASKLITAAAIMKLTEQGSLRLESQVFGNNGILNDPQFLDLRSSNLEQITVEHLLRHTAGFSSPHGDPAFSSYGVARFLDRELPLTLDDMVLYATRNRLRYRPGGSYDYSNLGYMLLGKIIEEVSGMPYESYVKNYILYPAGCYNMFIGRNFAQNRPDNEVEYYEVKEAVPVEAYDGSGRLTMKSNGGNNVTLLGGAGGWVASSVELLRFVAAINGDSGKSDILSPESVEIMTRHSERNHPIGWASVNGNQWLRSGSMAGTSALIKHQVDGYTWVFIANSSAWIGPRISSYISSHISRALGRVKEWPARDLFGPESQGSSLELSWYDREFLNPENGATGTQLHNNANSAAGQKMTLF